MTTMQAPPRVRRPVSSRGRPRSLAGLARGFMVAGSEGGEVGAGHAHPATGRAWRPSFRRRHRSVALGTEQTGVVLRMRR